MPRKDFTTAQGSSLIGQLTKAFSIERRSELEAIATSYRNRMKVLQEEKTKKQISDEEGLNVGAKEMLLQTPAWCTVTSTSSVLGNRLTIGFRNIGCIYRKVNPPGCLVCGFNAKTLRSQSPKRSHYMHQLITALREGQHSGEVYDTLEFLGDGSFLNEQEIGKGTTQSLFEIVNRHSKITR
ncbi:MAG TPA: hypothetical protein VMX75_01930, partial [Spirochaetia bacterium]|nr:hypothetical protein [Spirochaetia bacterium]